MKRIILLLELLIVFCVFISCNKKADDTNKEQVVSTNETTNVTINNITDDTTDDTTNIKDTELILLLDDYSATLDGAYAEKYAYDLYEAYKRTGSKQFVDSLSDYDIPIVNHIVNLLVGKAINDDGNDAVEEFTTVFKTLKDDESLSEIKNYIVYDIYTWTLYYKISLNADAY